MSLKDIINKNMKLLFRNKETAFTIIFGPLLIILIVSFAFMGSSKINVEIGAYSSNYTILTDKFISALIDKDFRVNIMDSKESCIKKIEEGEFGACIIFPPDFEIAENKTNEVEFYVDNSRINFVYAIIDSLADEFNLQTTALSKELTQNILNRLFVTRTVVLEELNATAKAEFAMEKSVNLADDAISSLTNGSSVTLSTIDLKTIRGYATSLETDVKLVYDNAAEAIDNSIIGLKKARDECDECTNSTITQIEITINRLNEIQEKINQIYDDSPQKLETMYMLIDSASNAVNKLQEGYDDLNTRISAASNTLGGINESLIDVKNSILETKGRMQHLKGLIDSLEISEASTVAAPISTNVKPISRGEQVTFTYPYLLIVVIMFMGLMLGSMLVVTDKTSKAAFRNFTTTTKDEFFTLGAFATTFLIVMFQFIIIFILSFFFVSTPLFSNIITTLIVAIFAIALFSFIGMIIGHLSTSREGSMITSLALASIFLFISNLVVPIEGMNKIIQSIASINPYVVMSELMKRALLFHLPFWKIGYEIFIILAVCILLFIIIIEVQKYSKKKYFKQLSVGAGMLEVEEKKQITPLEIKGMKIFNLHDLLESLDKIPRHEFKEIVNEKFNPIRDWVLKDVGNKKLAKKLGVKSKERMILIIEKFIKKSRKK